MAISQSQLHRTAEAGRAILTAFENYAHGLKRLLEMFYKGDITSHNLMLALDAHKALPDAALAEPRVILAEELAHWRATAKKNIREQRYRGAFIDSPAPAPLSRPPSTSFDPPPVAQVPTAFTKDDRAAYENAKRQQQWITWAQTTLASGQDPGPRLRRLGFAYTGDEHEGRLEKLDQSSNATLPSSTATIGLMELQPGESRAIMEAETDNWGDPTARPEALQTIVKGESSE